MYNEKRLSQGQAFFLLLPTTSKKMAVIILRQMWRLWRAIHRFAITLRRADFNMREDIPCRRRLVVLAGNVDGACVTGIIADVQVLPVGIATHC